MRHLWESQLGTPGTLCNVQENYNTAVDTEFATTAVATATHLMPDHPVLLVSFFEVSLAFSSFCELICNVSYFIFFYVHPAMATTTITDPRLAARFGSSSNQVHWIMAAALAGMIGGYFVPFAKIYKRWKMCGLHTRLGRKRRRCCMP